MSNFHATDENGANFKTKKAFREAVASGAFVELADTSAFNPRGVIGVADLRPADVIVGPDPYTKRDWYANVKNGKVV